ncbi:Na+/H+ antiporter NhaC [Natranaerobius trueperi]|uniref:Na+/H+ antiporter NhaC n=1 Tax=Natranaerobius trueperi TaxID=759412 RepID=A0A226C3F5_9FIRM|nr:Na+/H+ antiporter NhaC [Natranaerobius trueperi]OWZ84999.1 Na+/H+ antiporter NhaC [Natranaerobius trueperi]
MDKQMKKPPVIVALIPILFLIVALSVSIIRLEADPHIPLVLSSAVAAFVAMLVGYKWNNVEQGIFDGIMMAMQAIVILMVVGMLIGTWIQGGVVPTMIYYGLQILSPQIFLIAAMIISAVVAISVGSSWSTVGTIGIALVGIGEGLGVPTGMVAGSIISGAYIGDKLSPLSDTTNLASGTVGDTDLFEHIRHMLYVTVPAVVISGIIYGILGFTVVDSAQMEGGQIQTITSTLSEHFYISPVLLLAPILVIGLIVMKVPPIPGLLGGSILGAIFAITFQGADFASVVETMHYGPEIETGVEMVDGLLNEGGLDGMMWTISLIMAALSLGGILEKCGFLQVILEGVLTIAHRVGILSLISHVVSIFVNLVTADQYLSIVLPSRMFRDAFKAKNVHPKNLSRIAESAGTVTSPLIPWNTCGAFMAGALGISPVVYLPFAFFNLLAPLISIIYGFTGFSMTKWEEEESS